MIDRILPPILLFDCSYIGYRCFYGMPRLEWEEMDTSVLYGFFEEVFRAARTFRTHNFYFCFDSATADSLRKKLFPDYKKKRKQLAEDEAEARARMYYALSLLRETILPALGFRNIFYQTGYEADDLMHQLISQAGTFEGRHVMVTGDEDMYQTLQFPGTSFYNYKREYNQRDFVKEFGIPAKKWPIVKSICGCKSDEVPGIFKVGPATAIKFMKGILSPKQKLYGDIIKGREIIHRNRKLVTLPFPGLPTLQVKQDCVTREKMEAIAEEYGFRSWLDSEDWNFYFTGSRPKKKPRKVTR